MKDMKPMKEMKGGKGVFAQSRDKKLNGGSEAQKMTRGVVKK